MLRIKNTFIILFTMVFVFTISCKDLDELNINPNQVDPAIADLNLLLPTIITSIGNNVVGLGFGDIAGVMQHTQKDGWSSGHNDYNWNNSSKSWNGYYGILRNADEYYNKAVEGEYAFHQGVGLILKAYTFGMIADLWGDAPYTDALKAEEGPDYFKPAFTPQEEIYTGILADLEEANTLLSGSQGEYTNINASQDVLFNGDVKKWQMFANSLALRYYMRLSAKKPSVAQQGIQKITGDASKYPLMTSAANDANVSYPGLSTSDSWPTNTVFDLSPSGSYMRIKLCSTLVDKMQDLNDPRLGVWGNKIETPLVLVSGEGIDRIVDGVREISQDVIDDYVDSWGVGVDFDPDYVGIPPSVWAAPQYNLNPYLDQGVFNPHASQLNDIYKETSGDLLLMRLMSAAEVNFVLAEAAEYGWASGDAATYYNEGIKQSMIAWGVADEYDEYVAGAAYSGIESLITQKWIASWSAAAEAWFDYRRTGYPVLTTGESAKRQALPLRFPYHYEDEISKNTANADVAIEKLELVLPGLDDGKNGAWSKSWLLQGTSLPY